jgi:hypothetical protein
MIFLIFLGAGNMKNESYRGGGDKNHGLCTDSSFICEEERTTKETSR